jgi:hypothetical protein
MSREMRKTLCTGAYVLLSACVALAALLLPNLLLKPLPLPMNDLHLAGLVSPGRYFVADSTGAAAGLLRTAPELTRLDNGTETFSAVKGPGKFRIFCVGGSTTRGWSFHKELSYPLLLAR